MLLKSAEPTLQSTLGSKSILPLPHGSEQFLNSLVAQKCRKAPFSWVLIATPTTAVSITQY